MDVPPPLLTDLYELTMAAVYVEDGRADEHATFSLFVRDLPPDRGYLVAAGLGDALAYLEGLRFSADDVAGLADLGLFGDTFLDWLRQARFGGSVRAVPEGRIVFGGEPLLEVDAPLALAQIVETALLNQVTFQTALAAKAARCRDAARGRAVVDFALRRTHGTDAGMKLVRCGRIVGLAGTSNVAGALRYGARASGTMAHSFVQSYEREEEAFDVFARTYGDSTILLVDTYDTQRGVERAIEVGTAMRDRGRRLRAIRLDSGDLEALSKQARSMLDSAGLADVQILASGGLDEYAIDALLDAGAPIDGFGVGSALGVSKDVPVLDSVYKLVQVGTRPVRKTSTGKELWPGPKQVWRRAGWQGDVISGAGEEPPVRDAEALLVTVMEGGRRVGPGLDEFDELDAANRRFEADLAALPQPYRRLRDPDRYPVEVSPGLRALTDEIDAARH